MRLTLRLVAALVISTTAVTLLSAFLQERQERSRLMEDLDRRAAIAGETLEEPVATAVYHQDGREALRVVGKYSRRAHLVGVAVFAADGKELAESPALSRGDAVIKAAAARSQALEGSESAVAEIEGKPRHLYAMPLRRDGDIVGTLVLVQDAQIVESRIALMWRRNFMRLLLQAFLIMLVSLWIVRWNVAAPLEGLAEWMKSLRSGEPSEIPRVALDILKPVASEAASLAQSLSAAKAAAEEEARLREKAEAVWTPQRLKEHVRNKLEGRPLFLVANREPYMHVLRGRRVEVVTPPSGLVTGIEPIMLACGGTWIAHGSGEADRENSDAHGKLGVPPDNPQYTLKRVWLTKEEEEGYYYGFSNEGLWPLCHIAHTRPVFNPEDWAQYQAVNRKFADALLEEMKDVSSPCVLIQDYHFALLPTLVREARPDARIALFWHIPWPNPEAFGILPWQRQILTGMLGADLIGFHIQFHCNNFLETVDRYLESRIDWERFAVGRRGHTTFVKPYPISVAYPPQPAAANAKTAPDKEALFKELGIKARFMGVGVDRLDYTKGIMERFRSLERLLEKYPEYQGNLVFVELGAPSRTHIKRYHDLQTEIEAEAERINWRWKAKDYKPIVILARQHSHAEIEPYYKAADFCLVTSLHDGMNLVAKEFVAAREDERGVLILSRFTGAARELREALIVNPYDTEQMAEAIRLGIEMEEGEQMRRMRSLQRVLREQNIYRWGGRLIEDLAQIPSADLPAGSQASPSASPKT
jgi:trehalose 6-phosphate synthase